VKRLQKELKSWILEVILKLSGKSSNFSCVLRFCDFS
jgi:hypothetical protein